ncbi:MAG: class I SAM-dependent RNA methyltransferase [Desulfobacterales bacterium]|nr:class I SAM-dependent RNA methyltransferase [Desulfobacterales bacterium]
MYNYQTNQQFFAQIADGVKDSGSRELSELGARWVKPAYGGVHFKADMETLYRINYGARLASRILAPLASFNCRTADQLYKRTKQIRWTDFLSIHDTFAVYGNVSNSGINNSHYASLRLKDGIVDSFREKTGKRPNIDARDPDLWLNLYIREDRAVISLDASGGSLHRRGYRKDAISAPMQETVAAAIIGYTKWNGSVPLYDPMCGSGTLLAEALIRYCKIPPGFLRERFGFEFLPDYNSAQWKKVKKDMDRKIRSLPDGRIAGGDLSPKAVKIARMNLKNLPHGEKIKLKAIDFKELDGFENSVIVANPPYGIRMGDKEQLDALYKSFGDFLKFKCKGSTAYIYFGDRAFLKKIGLRTAWKKPLKTGGLDGRLAKYELY